MKRALISVYDKTGIVEFSKGLIELGWEIISTGGSYKTLREADIPVLEVEDITNFPEILDGRVKTLNPYIHGGILYRREVEAHVKTINEMNINPIDMVVNNLYPFEETVKTPNATREEIIENIDIGGPSMIRAAAKNYSSVIVLVDSIDYPSILEELQTNGDVRLDKRRYLARKVFNYTAYYDTLISNYFNEIDGEMFPTMLTMAFNKNSELRYGENPHQRAAFYDEIRDTQGCLKNMVQIHGKELSFNNINDSNGALKILKEFQEPTVVAVKHANPCGIGSGIYISEAYKKAYESDTESIFGGIIASNREIDIEIANQINHIFIEVVIAPSFTDSALAILTTKKNIRLIKIDDITCSDYPEMDIKKTLGGLLIQEKDNLLLDEDMKVVTDRFPTDEEMKDLLFAWKSVKNINSNGVIIAKDQATIGIGLGEVNRYWAVENAIMRAWEKVNGSVIASDGFFPFSDSISLLGKTGIKAIIQPGGSIKDNEIIEEANKYGIAMVFTNIRHFKH